MLQVTDKGINAFLRLITFTFISSEYFTYVDLAQYKLFVAGNAAVMVIFLWLALC